MLSHLTLSTLAFEARIIYTSVLCYGETETFARGSTVKGGAVIRLDGHVGVYEASYWDRKRSIC